LGHNELPEPVCRFIEQHIQSAADIDTVLLLCREHGPWTAATLARELRIDDGQAREILDRLRRRGFFRSDDQAYWFEPRAPALRDAVALLAQLYPAYRVAIVAMIYGRPTGPIRDFSNAFRLRDDD
jgi:hypothetical protein